MDRSVHNYLPTHRIFHQVHGFILNYPLNARPAAFHRQMSRPFDTAKLLTDPLPPTSEREIRPCNSITISLSNFFIY